VWLLEFAKLLHVAKKVREVVGAWIKQIFHSCGN
jgi:hypothetical protein